MGTVVIVMVLGIGGLECSPVLEDFFLYPELPLHGDSFDFRWERKRQD
jgi:hypothetical protein